MGRIGVSYLDISKAATELQGKGVNPTVDALRELLGTGSRSTIGPYLKQWRSKQEEGNNSELPHELSSLVKGLYERLQQTADLKIEEVEKKAQDEIIKIQETLNQMSAQKDSLESELQNTTLKLTESRNFSEQLKSELENKKTVNFNLEANLRECEIRLNDRNDQIHLLEKQLNNVQVNLEHYRESMLLQREEEKRSHERELASLNREITDLKNQSSLIHQSNLKLNQKLDGVFLEKQQLEKDWYEQRGKTMELQEQLKTREFVTKNLEDKYSVLTQDYQTSQDKLDKLSETLLDKEKKLVFLEEKLSSMEDFRSLAENRAAELLNEKSFIAQENFELRQQLNKIMVTT